MARRLAAPPRATNAPFVEEAEAQRLVEARVNKGIISVIDPADIDNGALTLAKEARVRYDRTLRRPGKLDSTPAKPNSVKIQNSYLFKKNDGSTYQLRFTKSSLHRRGVGSWVAITGTLTGGDNDRFSIATVFDKCFFANGVDRIQVINGAVTTFADAGTNAPRVRYITGFYNRVVGAYEPQSASNGPINIVTSADGDTTKWPDDASPDPSAVRIPLIESPSDLADYITGVFGFTNVLIIAREKSIWVATKLPVASNPFNAYAAVPGVGSDCPHSIDSIPGGIVFVDTRTKSVWVYTTGGGVERIGINVEKDLVSGVSDPALVFGGYNPRDNEYSACVPIAGTAVVRSWTFSFNTKAWVYDEVDLLSALDDTDSPFTTFLSFDELAGTFDQLTGTFDGLVASSPPGRPARYYGYTNGNLLEESASATDDAGVAFTMDLQSKEFTLPSDDSHFAFFRIDYEAKVVGTLTLSYSKDGGQTWRTAKTVAVMQTSRGIVKFRKNIKARRLRWRLTASSSDISILGYEVWYYPGGESKQ